MQLKVRETILRYFLASSCGGETFQLEMVRLQVHVTMILLELLPLIIKRYVQMKLVALRDPLVMST